MDEMKDLERELEFELCGVNEQEAINPDYQVKNEDDAEWVLTRILDIMQEIEKIKQSQAKKAEILLAYYERKIKPLEWEIERRKGQLMLFADSHLALSKAKSFILPSGRVGFRSVGPKIERDEAQLLEFTKQYDPRFVKVKEELDWAGLKKRLKIDGDKMVNPDTGEVVPGVTVYKQPKKFFVEV